MQQGRSRSCGEPITCSHRTTMFSKALQMCPTQILAILAFLKALIWDPLFINFCLLISASLSFAGKYYMLEQKEAKCSAGGSTKYGTGN